jgi:Iap family predicted aminopeptidase
VNNRYRDVDRRIVAEVYTSSTLMDNLEVLCDVYGSRATGLPEDRGAVEWVVETLKGYGVENAHYETFDVPGWIRGPARLEIVDPVHKELDCISLPMGLAGQAEGRLVFLGDGELSSYEDRKDEIEGNVVMVTSRSPLGLDRRMHRSEKYLRSVMAGAKGWIFMNHYPAYGPPTGAISPIIPAVGVSHEDGSFLTRMLEREGEVHVRVTTTDENRTVETYNVIGDVGGSADDDTYVLVGCHYDGHDISQGALDPASGAVVVMEMARLFSDEAEGGLKRRLRLVLFGGEETGLFGSHHYVDRHQDELGSLRFMLNLDTAGRDGDKGILLHGQPELEDFIEAAASEATIEIPRMQKVTPYSDHWPFFLQGVPCGSGGDPEALRKKGGRGYGHTKYDTVDKVKMEDLREAAANYARLVLRIANADDWPGERLSEEEIEAFIEKVGFDETVALVEKAKGYVRTWEDLPPVTRDWLESTSDW